ncbi:MAG TPA: NADH-quinone oxidoreductase subunit M [Solirubrobacteraceae bacterium]|jgi:NADH-quinone oxidoreductase subunit M|nr:NADH-quinone oxidoreductase subunit M [Solirubrobacteraceae bacterium]
MPPLSILIWLPLAFGVLGALLSRLDEDMPVHIALLGSVGALALSIGYIVDYHAGTGLQHVTNVVWIAALGIHYKLGVSGLNVFLVGLTTLLFTAAIVSLLVREGALRPERPALFYFLFTLAESAVLGAFLAQDLVLFVAFFDLMLIPFYFLVGIDWQPSVPTPADRPDRVKATLKMVIYTLVGSLLMLAAAIAAGVLASEQHGTPITFVLSSLHSLPLSAGSQEWIFLFFAAAFLVKMPAFPLHGWMPDGYRAMPIEVLMVFSGVLSKVGAYGFLAIALPLFPHAAVHFQLLMLLIALGSIVYGSVMAFTQTDARLIVGFSSVAQMGFITLGIFALNPQGAQGALLQMVNHGLVVAPLFFIIALLAARAGGSEDVRDMGGIAFRAPVLATLFLIVSLATLAMPGSSNFVGEFLILLGVFKAKLAIAIVAFSGVVMASVYALRLFIRAMHNRVRDGVDSRELTLLDSAVLVPLVAVIIFLALYPQLALHRSESSVKAAVASVQAENHAASPFAAMERILRQNGDQPIIAKWGEATAEARR